MKATHRNLTRLATEKHDGWTQSCYHFIMRVLPSSKIVKIVSVTQESDCAAAKLPYFDVVAADFFFQF